MNRGGPRWTVTCNIARHALALAVQFEPFNDMHRGLVMTEEDMLTALHDEWINAAYGDRTTHICLPAMVPGSAPWINVFAQQLSEADNNSLVQLVHALTCCDEGKEVLELMAGAHAWTHLDAAMNNNPEA